MRADETTLRALVVILAAWFLASSACGADLVGLARISTATLSKSGSRKFVSRA